VLERFTRIIQGGTGVERPLHVSLAFHTLYTLSVSGSRCPS
jgi:hypothetical protein